jgi:peptidoglycan/xylan/chitin deacetylase (PgdA/CDA1 family)
MSFIICLTHDVDRIRKTYQYVTHDIRKRRLRNIKTLFNGTSPYWMFDTIMNMEVRYGVRSTFFFLNETIQLSPFSPSNWKLSLGRYRVNEPAVASLIQGLDAGGWEIGVHGSYNSYKDLNLLKAEKSALEDVLGKEIPGIRQHYLNLEIPGTWKLQRETGFQYDASYGLKNAIGFRNNRYHPFIDNESAMFVIPLSIMECYLFSTSRNDPATIWNNTLKLIDLTEKNNGVLCILWHSHMFNDNDFPGYSDIYRRIIEEGKERSAEFLTCGEIFTRYCVNNTIPED